MVIADKYTEPALHKLLRESRVWQPQYDDTQAAVYTRRPKPAEVSASPSAPADTAPIDPNKEGTPAPDGTNKAELPAKSQKKDAESG